MTGPRPGSTTGKLSTPHQVGLLILGAADRRLLGDFLRSLGHEVRTPAPAPGCVAAWTDVDLVIADEICAREHLDSLFALKREAGTITLPLLIAVPQARNSTPWLEAGFDEVVRLPVAKAELAARVGALLRLREASEERCRAEAVLRARAEELAEADRQKDAFLAMLGHELRNPLAPILNSAHTLRRLAADRPDLERHLDVIDRQGKQLARMVDDLLDVARITRGAIALQMEVVILAEVVERAGQSVRPLMEARGHHLSVTAPRETLLVEADPMRLEQILVNLLNNAAKYTDPGGRISLAAYRDGQEIVLEVCDTGRGIPREMLAHVFEPFTQVSPTLDRPLGGLGIGLALVKNLVAMHGGSIAAQSEGAGLGCRFTLRLPALEVDGAGKTSTPGPRPAGTQPAGTQPASSQPTGLPPSSPSRPRRVLIVDDNPDAAETLSEVVQLWGHEVRVAYDGPTALRSAESFDPEVVLLDIGLPGMDGYEVARRLRDRPGREKMRLFAITGYGQEGDRLLAQEAGFDAHLTKPLDIAALETRLSCPADG